VALGWRSPGVGTPLNSQALEKSSRLAIVRAGMMSASLVKHSVRIAGHATSVSLETAFWEALCEIAQRRRMSVNALLSAIDAERGGNLSSAIRLFVLESCRRGELVVPNALGGDALGGDASGGDPPGPPPRS
jgi:predicted DNA-binding ribbon-helix-helix protein